jgi:hypothetical protein
MARPNQNAPQSGKKALSRVERQRQALELRKAGVKFQTIADQLGYAGPSGAYVAVKAALKATLQQPADDVRQMELERIDELWFIAYTAARRGDLGAIDRCIRLLRRRADMLGLDAPIKRETTVSFILQNFAERAALEAGLDPALVLAEAERILAEGIG